MIQNNTKLLEDLLKEELELQFNYFNNDTAWTIGNILVEEAKRRELSVAVDITLNRHQLFHYSMAGTSLDNDCWVKGKYRVVERFGHSSYYVGRLLASEGQTMDTMFLESESVYRAHGGAFPIIIKNTGAIGAIIVSGLPQEEDHALVVWAIRKYLNA